MSPSSSSPSPSGRAIARVGIVAKASLVGVATVLREVADWLAARGIRAVFERETAALAGRTDHASPTKDELARMVDLVLVLGGDGTLIGMANRIVTADADIPILAVNFGSLGFLTEITLPELYSSLESTLSGTAEIEYRQMLQSRVVRDGRLLADRLMLNDVAITKGALSSIIDLWVSVGDQFVTHVRADGLIVASPTGSTAYNLSAGGPIVHPAVDALLITPIAPHTLTQRPVVIPASSEVRIRPKLDGPHEEAFVSFDGQCGFQLRHDDLVTIRQAARPLKLVRAEARNYFAVLREKLKWGER
jgi:NAD+ kinase